MFHHDKLVVLRKARGMSQDAVAKALGVGYQAYARWERGDNTPRTDSLEKLSRFFEVEPAWFYQGPETKPRETEYHHNEDNTEALAADLARELDRSIQTDLASLDRPLVYKALRSLYSNCEPCLRAQLLLSQRLRRQRKRSSVLPPFKFWLGYAVYGGTEDNCLLTSM